MFIASMVTAPEVEAEAVAAGAAEKAVTNLHHAFPKFMGGEANQIRTEMSRDLHVALHQDLNRFLKANYPNMVTSRGYSGAAMRLLVPIEDTTNAMVHFYNTIGAKYNNAARDFFNQIK